jgi:hypothetical protein
MDRALDRLAAASRVFFEQRIIDLRKENEELRAREAWNSFGLESLEKSLVYACHEYYPTACSCMSCWKAKRFDSEGSTMEEIMHDFIKYSGHECVVRKCLILHAQRCGLIVAVRKSPPFLHPDIDPKEWVKISQHFHEETPDCHLQILENEDGTWNLYYGPKFSRVRFHLNPDLNKLKKLFKIIDQDDECDDLFWFDGGIDLVRATNSRE